LADFKVVVSDPKTKSYQFDVKGPEANKFIGKVIGQDIDGSVVGLSGYKLMITGGSDKSGIVMRADLPGPKRKKILAATGVGYSPKAKGIRRRKTMHGKEISSDIVQINTKVVGYGERSIEEILGGGKTEE